MRDLESISSQIFRTSVLFGLCGWMRLTDTESPPISRIIPVTAILALTQVLSIVISTFLHRIPMRHPEHRRRLTFYEIGQMSGTVAGWTLLSHLAIVLLGAPVTGKFVETFCLAVVISFLTGTPLFEAVLIRRRESSPSNLIPNCLMSIEVFDLIFNIDDPAKVTKDEAAWMRKSRKYPDKFPPPPPPSRFPVVHFYTVLVGCWLATLCYKLDWMKVWQEYPVSSIAGVMMTSLVAHILNLIWKVLKWMAKKTNY